MNPFKRPAHTLLYITGNKICRLDANRKGQILGQLEIFDIPCESSLALPNTIEKLILQIQQPLGRQCWILYSHLLSYELSLPSAQIAGVDNSVVAQALEFEFETLTGETLKNQQMVFQKLYTADEMSHFWVNLISKDVLEKIMERLQKGKSALGGLMHSGGLPQLLTVSDTTSWLKLEYWPTSVFAVAAKPDHDIEMLILHRQQNAHWQEELKHWLLGQGTFAESEALTTTLQAENNAYVTNSYALTPEGSLLKWLELWLQHLIVKEAAGIPLLAQQANVNKELFYMIGSGIAALLLCTSHAGWVWYQTRSYENDTAELTKLQQQLDSYRKTVTDNQTQIDKLQKEQSDLQVHVKSIPAAMSALKERPAMLLKIIAQNCPEDVVIEDIKQDTQQVLITGVALKAELTNELAVKIEHPLAALGWKVREPSSHSLDAFGKDNGPWEFNLILEDSGLTSFLKQP